MNLDYSPSEANFRREVLTFLEANVPSTARGKLLRGEELDKQEIVEWVRVLNRKGWAVPHWPEQWGGAGWSLLEQMIFRELAQQVPAPEAPSFGVSMVGPVIYTFGSEEQKRRFLPRIANLDDWWCQGFSEAGAGSDLASLGTTARLDGNEWVISGQKTWTSLAQHADWMFLLARTDIDAPRRQQGISFLLADMRTPGITVNPIRTIDGGHEINEVFFDKVRIPAENLVGEENKGWNYAKFLLGNERIGQARVGLIKAKLKRIRAVLEGAKADSPPALRIAAFEHRLVSLEVDVRALEMTQLRMLSDSDGTGAARNQPLSSVLKIKGSETLQQATELLYDLSGLHALAGSVQFADLGERPEQQLLAMAAVSYFNNRKVSIYGGSNEIQRNIIAQAVIGA
jgi:alkylation response protein AidB-like acyl-CoA dehydrogenase